MFALFLTDQARGVDGFPFEEQDKPVGWAWWALWEGGGISFYMESRLMPSLLEESEYTPRAENVCVCALVFSDQSPAAPLPQYASKEGGSSRPTGKKKRKGPQWFPQVYSDKLGVTSGRASVIGESLSRRMRQAAMCVVMLKDGEE